MDKKNEKFYMNIYFHVKNDGIDCRNFQNKKNVVFSHHKTCPRTRVRKLDVI